MATAKRSGGLKAFTSDTQFLVQAFGESLHGSSFLEKIERSTNISRLYVVGAFGAFFASFLLFGVGSRVICNTAGFVYPLYASFKAVKTPSTDDDKQWLTYWIVFAFFQLVESITDLFFRWLPLYHFLKLLFLVWCYLPHFRGATTVYYGLIAPFLEEAEDDLRAAKKQVVNSIRMSLTSATGHSSLLKPPGSGSDASSGNYPSTPPPSVAAPAGIASATYPTTPNNSVASGSSLYPATPPPSAVQPMEMRRSLPVERSSPVLFEESANEVSSEAQVDSVDHAHES